VRERRVDAGSVAVLDATAHALKFAVFQEKYFSDGFEPEYEVSPKEELQNEPHLISPPEGVPRPSQDVRLDPTEFERFLRFSGEAIAGLLGLKPR
jgi:threonine synthase